ncbi:ABC transporter ATP-binding protein [Nitriliruptoraceae bacterium ZYF776]|nr:ABC transporter ATP-binding protein [Profundirhabdus halotolerans]
MAEVRVEQLTKTFPSKPPVVAADALDLTIEDGEFLVLLGPSGCGKTTTLRCLAGLEEPDSGRILFDGAAVFDGASGRNLSPDRRSIGMVFQSYALWPHLSVRRNIEYPLRARKLKQGLKDDWAGEVAELVDCGHLLDRLPGQLSGGQQQRIALARGLVARPDLVLFDEPLSNLDAKLRDQVRAQLHELHVRLGFTAVFVTHDQSEAFALADRIVILNAGRIEQCDTARRTWHAPVSDYVASFIGMSNRITMERTGTGWSLGEHHSEGAEIPVPRGVDRMAARLRPSDVTLARPEEPAPRDCVQLPGRFVAATFAGDQLDAVVRVDGQRLLARCPLDGGRSWLDGLEDGAPVSVRFQPQAARYFDLEGGHDVGDPGPEAAVDVPALTSGEALTRGPA